jgi:hypothetical protein
MSGWWPLAIAIVGALSGVATVVQTAVFLYVTFRAEERVLSGSSSPSYGRRTIVIMALLTLLSWVGFGLNYFGRPPVPVPQSRSVLFIQALDPTIELSRINDATELLTGKFAIWLSAVERYHEGVRDDLSKDAQKRPEVTDHRGIKLALQGEEIFNDMATIEILDESTAATLPMYCAVIEAYMQSHSQSDPSYKLGLSPLEHEFAIHIRSVKEWQATALRELDDRRRQLSK